VTEHEKNCRDAVKTCGNILIAAYFFSNRQDDVQTTAAKVTADLEKISDETNSPLGFLRATLDRSQEIIASINHFTNIQGPQKCPRRCSECSDGNHHWMITTFPGCLDEECDDWEEAKSHPAVQEWLAALQNYPQSHEDRDSIDWLQCKHCEAWHELTEEMMDDPDFEIV
jgi:hypothetical protein